MEEIENVADPAGARVTEAETLPLPEAGHDEPAVAEQVRRDDGVVLGQYRDQFAPGVRRVADPVHEQQYRALPGAHEGPAVPVDGAELPARLVVADAGQRPFAGAPAASGEQSHV